MSRGDWFRYDAKTAVEHCQRLDIRELNIKSLAVNNRINLTYNVRSRTGEQRTINETILIDWTPCYFGGERAWWLCLGCGRRVAILYLRMTGYRCRSCHNLAYGSAQESKFDRHLRKKFKICDKLGIGPIERPLFKPKYMHQKTFNRLLWQHLHADQVTVQDLEMQLKILKKQSR